MNFSHRSRNPQNVPNTKDETIQRQFERFERIRVFDGHHDAIISKSSRPCPGNRSQSLDLCNRLNKRITNEELLDIRTLQSPSDTRFRTVESSRVSSQGGSPRAPLTGTINQDLMDRLDEILDSFCLPKSVQ